MADQTLQGGKYQPYRRGSTAKPWDLELDGVFLRGELSPEKNDLERAIDG